MSLSCYPKMSVKGLTQELYWTQDPEAIIKEEEEKQEYNFSKWAG